MCGTVFILWAVLYFGICYYHTVGILSSAHFHRYLYEATHLLDRISLLKKEFDSDLCWLRHDKMSLDVQMKMADLR